MTSEDLRRSRTCPRVDTMYSQRSDSNASLNVLVSTPITDDCRWDPPRSYSFPTLPSPDTSTPSSSDHNNDGDSFFLRDPAFILGETASLGWNHSVNTVNVTHTKAHGHSKAFGGSEYGQIYPRALTSDLSREHRYKVSYQERYIGDHSYFPNRLFEPSNCLSRNGSRPAAAQGRPNILTKRRRSHNVDKPIYRNSILLQPQVPVVLGVISQPPLCHSADTPNNRCLEDAPEVKHDRRSFLMPLTSTSTVVSQHDAHSNKCGSSNGFNSGNKIAPLSAAPSAYKGRSTTSLTRDTPLELRVSHGQVNYFPSTSPPRIRRPSQKLTKRRPPSIAPPPTSSAALLSELSPSPLSLEDIAAAKRTLQPAPPPVPTLPDYLPKATRRTRTSLPDNEVPIRRWNRLSLRELADREEMAETLPPTRPRTLFKLPVKCQSIYIHCYTHTVLSADVSEMEDQQNQFPFVCFKS